MNETTRYCKKCGCELVSTNKYKVCDNCRRKSAEKIRNIVLMIVGTIGTIGTAAVTVAKSIKGQGENEQ